VDQWLDVIEEFPAAVRMQLLPPADASENAAAGRQTASLFEQALEPDQKAVFDILRADEALFVDSICGSVSLSQPRVLAALLTLEMSGLVKQLPGKNFIRKL
jgi:DNA processing protein